MQGSSRAAAAASRDAFTEALAGDADRSRLAEDLFAVVALLDGNATLRRAVSDPSREGAEKKMLVERLLIGKVGSEALGVLQAVAGQRWSSDRDLTNTLESFGVESVIASAERAGTADRLEDDLFRFERIVAADADLRTALGDQTAPADKRIALVDSLLRGKVGDETLALVHQAVSAPRGRRFDRIVESYLATAAHRRQQMTAVITSAVPLSDGDRDRLVRGLSEVYGGTVHVNTVVDPRVMGGIRVEIGDEVIDGSILRKLEGARRAMGA